MSEVPCTPLEGLECGTHLDLQIKSNRIIERRNLFDVEVDVWPGSEAGSYLRFIDFVHHSILGLRVTKKKIKKTRRNLFDVEVDVRAGREARHPPRRTTV